MIHSLKIPKLLRAAAVAAPLAFGATPSHALPVGLELSLLIDSSGSIDQAEYLLQRNGYAQAFQSAAVQNAILASQLGSIAVNFVQFSGAANQLQSVGWTLIDSVSSANAFATAISGVSRTLFGSTATGSALNFATPLFAGNGFEGLREAIDLSGDGEANDGANTVAARDAALAAGIDSINGLAIGDASLITWYEANIKGGADSFVIGVDSFGDFAEAIERKLIAEITGQVPEPGSLALLGMALIGLLMFRRIKA